MPKQTDPPAVEFFYDFVSPYSYLASTRIDALAARHGAVARYRPVHLKTLINESGNKGPTEIPAKIRYVMDDLQRWAARYQVTLKLPPAFHLSLRSTLPLRVALAAESVGDEALRTLTHALFRAFWVEGCDIVSPKAVAAVVDRAGFDAASLLAAAAPLKDAVMARTRDALRRGAFGLPTCFVGEAMFVGNDRLDFVEEELARRIDPAREFV